MDLKTTPTTDEEKPYKLYAMPAGHITSDAEFFFLLPDIDLIYTQEPPAHAMEVTDPEQIPAAARIWLAETIEEIAKRYLAENEDALLEGTKTFMDRFRKELETEHRNLAKKTVRVKARQAPCAV